MQSRYAGDIGDFVKLAILRALSPGFRVGVAWWLFPNEDHNGDGRHIDYLQRPERWRHLDPKLFDALQQIVGSGQRSVAALEEAQLFPDALFASEVIPTGGPIAERREARATWFTEVVASLSDADIVFADPDNGLEPDSFSPAASMAGKSVTIAEVQALAGSGRCVVVYHHHTRRRGGHAEEIEYWGGRLREAGFDRVDALRARPYSPRAFFVLNGTETIRQRAAEIGERWTGLITWHPGVGQERPYAVGSMSATSAKSAEPKRAVAMASGPNAVGRGSTTQIGYLNRNGQEVIRTTGLPGTDHGQSIYVLRCRACGHQYGANGSDIWLRRCPRHDRGAPGLVY